MKVSGGRNKKVRVEEDQDTNKVKEEKVEKEQRGTRSQKMEI